MKHKFFSVSLLFGSICIIGLLFIFLISFQNPPKEEKTFFKEISAQVDFFRQTGEYDSVLYYINIGIKEAIAAKDSIEESDFFGEKLSLIPLLSDYDPTLISELIDKEWKKEYANRPLFLQHIYIAKARYFVLLGEMDSLDYYYQAAEKENEKTKKNDALFVGAVSIAVDFYENQDYFIARTYILKAEDILKKGIEKEDNIGAFYNIYSAINYEIGFAEDALKGALAALEYLKQDETASPTDLAYDYNNVGALYNALEDYSNALEYYKQALYYSEQTNEEQEIAVSLQNMGYTYQLLNKYDEAIDCALRSIQLLQGVPEGKEKAKDLLQSYYLGIKGYNAKNNIDSAGYFLSLAEKKLQVTEYNLESFYACKGKFFKNKKDWKNALEAFEKSLEYSLSKCGKKNRHVATFFSDIAKIYMAIGDNLSALTYTQKSMVANVVEFDEEQDFLKNPSIENTIINKSNLLYSSKLKTGTLEKIYRSQNQLNLQLEDVLASAILSVELLEDMNRTSRNEASKRYWLSKEAVSIYEKAIAITLELYEKTGKESYYDEAFQLAERIKSVLLTQALQEQKAGIFGGVPDTIIQKKDRVERIISDLEKKRFDALLQKREDLAAQFEKTIFESKYELQVLKKELEQNYPKYYKLKYENKVIDVASLRQQLDENNLFISYFEGEEKLYTFVLSSKEATYHSIDIEEKFKKDIMNFQAQLSNLSRAIAEPAAAYNEYSQKAYQYYQMLLMPALKKANPSTRLIIIPDGVLGYIPFEAFLYEKVTTITEDDLPNYNKLPYLLQQYPISYNYSATLWASQMGEELQAPLNKNKILAMAPLYGKNADIDSNALAKQIRSPKEKALRATLSELPGAAAEVKILESKYAGLFLREMEANEKNLKEKAGEYSILHLAMHGLVDEQNPEFSSLALSEDKYPKEDNFMYAYEIKQLNLNAELVVLSACETGVGKYQRGEGVVSIGRGFMYAGAQSLLMTLWSLNDQSALRLIELFYENITQGMPKDIALQKAKMEYIKKNDVIAAHPALWACFVQLGHTRPISIEKKSNFLVYLGLIGGVVLVGGIIFAIWRATAKQPFKEKAA